MMILSIFYNFLKIIFFRDKNVHTASNGIGSRHCIMYIVQHAQIAHTVYQLEEEEG